MGLSVKLLLKLLFRRGVSTPASFSLVLSNPTGATIADGTGTVVVT